MSPLPCLPRKFYFWFPQGVSDTFKSMVELTMKLWDAMGIQWDYYYSMDYSTLGKVTSILELIVNNRVPEEIFTIKQNCWTYSIAAVPHEVIDYSGNEKTYLITPSNS